MIYTFEVIYLVGKPARFPASFEVENQAMVKNIESVQNDDFLDKLTSLAPSDV